ncbi:MAG: pectate lyase [bacterium]
MKSKNINFMIFIILLFSFFNSTAQTINKGYTNQNIDLSDFDNSARHWYFIKDKDKIIEPLLNQKQYNQDEYNLIAENILLFQKNNGGWAKNYDMQAILTEEQKTAVINDKSRLNTCFDNSTTWGQLNYLAQVYNKTKNVNYKIGFINGIDFILSAQYPNGGWPQFYPDTSGYGKHITFNDGAMIGVMKLLKKIVDKDTIYNIVNLKQYDLVKVAYLKGIDCILNSQIKYKDSLLVWCQQHNNITLAPVKARAYELASICNGESAEIVTFLMSINNPNKETINSVISAVKWFEKSKIKGIQVKTIEAEKTEYEYSTGTTDRIIVKDNNAPVIWARYYDLQTLKPLFCNRDGVAVDSFEKVDRERRAGYAWYVYDPQTVLDNYSAWLKQVKISN